MQGRQSNDIELTQANGKRLAVNAFSIAVLDGLRNRTVIFEGEKIKVRESYDDIMAAKQKVLNGPPQVKKAPVARTPVGFKNYS